MVKVNVARDLGLAVRGRRVDLGLSQDAVAVRAGVSRRWLSAFESGKGSVELGMVLRTLAALDLELRVDAVVADDGDAPATLRPDDANVDLDVVLSRFDEDGR